MVLNEYVNRTNRYLTEYDTSESDSNDTYSILDPGSETRSSVRTFSSGPKGSEDPVLILRMTRLSYRHEC